MGTKPCITVAPFILLVPLCVYQQANKVTLMLSHCFKLLLLLLECINDQQTFTNCPMHPLLLTSTAATT